MNIHEYQAKAILKQYGAPTPKGIVVSSIDEIENKIKETYPNISVRLNDIKIIFDVTKLTINLETKNPIIIAREQEINLNNISTIYKINSIFRN